MVQSARGGLAITSQFAGRYVAIALSQDLVKTLVVSVCRYRTGHLNLLLPWQRRVLGMMSRVASGGLFRHFSWKLGVGFRREFDASAP